MSRRRHVVIAAAVLLLAGCNQGVDRSGIGDEDGPRGPAIKVQFNDGPLHLFSAEEEATITKIAEVTVDELGVLLPDLAGTVTLDVWTGTTVIPETGEVGAAWTPELVRWLVDPAKPGGIEQIARAHLRSTLFHELHHLVRGHVLSDRTPPDSFMDHVVSEGLASVFERDAAADREVLWAQYPAEVETWVEELRALHADADYGHWMFEHPDGRRWIGYRAGAFLVDRAVEASGRSAADLVHASTEEILGLAGYG